MSPTKAFARTSIRQATPADAAVVAQLGRTTFAETFGYLFTDHGDDLDDYLEATFAVAKIWRSLQDPDNFYWLAFVDGRPIGYAKLKYRSATGFLAVRDAAQLQKIYLLKDFLGRGIGAALLEASLARAASLRASAIWLAVLRENEPAIRFCRRFGFERLGPHQFTVGEQTFEFDILGRQAPGDGKPA